MKKLLCCLVILILLSGCADNIPYTLNSIVTPVGFLHGWWHGVIIVWSWLFSLFSDNVSIYAAYNNGGWYDFGFMLGIGSLSGCVNKAI